jgi:hypothetical protein
VLRRPAYALSLKQPWAGLVIAGQKTIEVRKWATGVRGRVYIHAAGKPDDRAEAWALVSDDLRPMTQLLGGIIGAADLMGCVLYRTAEGFEADVDKHRNPPAWFEPPRMYGFLFRAAAASPFQRCRGSVRFFTVKLTEAG